MSDIPAFPYEILWGERALGSVANLTRRDGEEFLELAPQVPVRTEVEVHPLEAANEALDSISQRPPPRRRGSRRQRGLAEEVLVAGAAEGHGAGAVAPR